VPHQSHEYPDLRQPYNRTSRSLRFT
jgi:hypothetical protein